jgi:hypothetical protein
MIDVNKITSTLAKLPDAQLQQYAQLHKADPYIMSLAMSESNRRKEMRAASQGAQGMQAQPKVVDSEIAQMAPQQAQAMPEDQGIGQLPAGNMNFAGGGIIAFADGGDVERYQVGGALTGTTYADTMGFGVSPELLAMDEARVEEILARRKAAEDAERLKFLETAAPETAARLKAAQQPALPYNRATTPAAGYTRTDPRAAGADTFAESVKAVSAAPTADTTRKAPTAGLGAAAAANAAAQKSTGPTDIEALQQKYFGPIDQEVGGLRNARAGLVEGIKDLADQNLAATKAGIEQRGDVYKGREERLAKQEKGLESMGDKYMGLALLQAGAAMMTTPGGIGAALGKGIDTGSKQYAMGMEKINAAKEKFAEARDRLDDLRINRDDMNAKDIRAAEKEARESKLKGQELLYNGLVSDLGIKQKNVTAIFGAAADDLKTTRQIEAERQNTITREGGANARNAATIAAQLNTPDRLVFDKLLKDNNNDAVKAAEALQKMKAEKFNMYEAYSKYLTGFAGKETMTPPMDFDQFASKFTVPTTKTPGKGATVLTQP